MSADSLAPLLVVVAAVSLTVYCFVDIARHPDTRRFPAQTWMLICLFTSVLGAIAYLKLGRSADR